MLRRKTRSSEEKRVFVGDTVFLYLLCKHIEPDCDSAANNRNNT